MEDGGAGWVLAVDHPVTKCSSVAVTDVGEGCNPKKKSASLGVYKLNGEDIGEGCKVFHEKTVAKALGVDPLVLFETKVTSDVIKEFPCVGEVARVDVEALLVT